MSVDTVFRVPITLRVMYEEWRGYPPGEGHRSSTKCSSVRHNNYGEYLAEVEPTASIIAEGKLSTDEGWPRNHVVY